jgi:hypothetical protein
MPLINVGSNDNVDTDSDYDDSGSGEPVAPILGSRWVHSPTTARVLVRLQAWVNWDPRASVSQVGGSNRAAFQPTPCGHVGVVR